RRASARLAAESDAAALRRRQRTFERNRLPGPSAEHELQGQRSTDQGDMSSEHKQRKRAEMKKLLDQIENGEHPYGKKGPLRTRPEHCCWSQTCIECGKVWLSAIKAIKPNAYRKGKRVYICGICRK